MVKLGRVTKGQTLIINHTLIHIFKFICEKLRWTFGRFVWHSSCNAAKCKFKCVINFNIVKLLLAKFIVLLKHWECNGLKHTIYSCSCPLQVCPCSLIHYHCCSLHSPCWLNRLSNKGPVSALPVSYGTVGPNWMRARLPQPYLLIILITLTQIRAGCLDLSTTHKELVLLSVQLPLMEKKVCVQQWMCL